MVKPEMVTSDAKFSKTRKVPLPLTARFPAPGAVDGDVIRNLKFAAGQQNRARDAGSVNRVTVIRDNERVAQRPGAAVIGVCDYNDVSRRPVVESR